MNDFKIAPNFSFFEATSTSRKGFIVQNREMGQRRIGKIAYLFALLQGIREKLGVPIRVHSGYRCPDLNASIGGSKTSQHMKAEAVDWSPSGCEYDREVMRSAFRTSVDLLKRHEIMFGQIIFEEKTYENGSNFWIHFSLGAPFRPLEKCGQVMRFLDGDYSMIEKVDFPSWD